MILRVQKRTDPYVRIDKRPLEDVRLSWKARGLLAYLLSKPDSWVVVFDHLVKQAPDGRDSCRSAVRELERAGYMRKVRRTDSTGRVMRWEYVVYELPQTENPSVDDSRPEEPQPENPFVGETLTGIAETPEWCGSGPQTAFPQTENPTLVTNDLLVTNEVSQLQGGSEASPPVEKPPKARREPRYTRIPVEEWAASDLLAYVVDEFRKRGRELVTPKNGAGQHLKMLLLRAGGMYNGKASVAVKALVDECLDRPDMTGTGYLLHEAERFWARWRLPAEDITAETW